MTNARDHILDAAERLLIQGKVPPPLQAVADEAGVSKGGVLYHFTTQTLLHGVIERAVRMADERLTAAAESGSMAAEWLRLSMPDEHERRLYRAMLSMLRVSAMGDLDLPRGVDEAVHRWERMLEEELADAARAQVVRLVGDGLFLNALTGHPPSAAAVEQLIRHLGLAAGSG
ncbi:hypothetical protein BBK82_31185 [Lentzea guizhouensis]|uniref:TetR family transcriptional regulator n=1 Tax=Lentzea guizhouensis TaxID=1586287 RepID=A0A1B2HQ50_9PSEU|nr:TetR family transcriptional regulator [Lentzea guizhouensis]ANZ39850.1 hypothetical protein BBK82_31185 [Lentzea guizhouensis]